MNKLLSLLFLINFTPSNAFSEVFIVNVANTQKNLSTFQVKDIFLGNMLFWDNEEKISVIEYNATSALRLIVSQKYFGMPPNQVYMKWIRVSLSGKAYPPKILRSEYEVEQAVLHNPGAIGYISNSQNLPIGLRTISID